MGADKVRDVATRDQGEHSAPEGVFAPRLSGGPKLELDELLEQLIERAQDVLSAQGRLRGLLRANQTLAGNVTLPVLLDRIVHAACELTHARYGALGIIDPVGGLEQFVHAAADLPTPSRRSDRTGASLSAVSALVIPIHVRDALFANLYLTERESGEFTADEEELASALAATAGVAIENVRLHEEAGRRQDWLQASTEVNEQLLSAEGEDPLRLIARQARRLADADIVTVLLPTVDSDRLIVEFASGDGADALIARTSPIADTLVGLAFTSGHPILVADIEEDQRYTVHLSDVVPVGPVMVLPLGGSQRARGALVVGRARGRRQFAQADLEMATTFANHAAVALELADARADQQRIVLLEDRDRIARDLHDHVIQRLFATGLTVQSVASGLGTDDRATRLNRVVSDIDETIRQTRTSIFQLRGPLGPETGTVRARLLAVAAEISPLFSFEPQVRFSGPIDAVVPESVADDLVAVLREALTNAARHAHASSVDVDVDASITELSLDVTDDGVGIGATRRRSGLANLSQRAEGHGGTLVLVNSDLHQSHGNQEGTRLRWTIPLT